MAHPPKRAALYGRVSTSGNGQDVQMQMEELRQVAKQRGWVVTEFIDEGVSGAKTHRPALDMLMTAARSGKLDVVAVWRFDRFARSTQHLLSALDEFRLCGVEFLSLRENVETSTPVGKMVFTLIAAIAEFERALIQERVQAGVAHAQELGKHCGRPKVELDLRAAEVLLAQGHSMRSVADMLGLPRSTLARKLQESSGPKVSLSLPPESLS